MVQNDVSEGNGDFGCGGPWEGRATSQFTKRRMRMFMTMPSERNVNRIDEPP